ncbi:hypothetical protein [Pseudarthrobacter sp. YAF2]|uniref:hypothetical protein n=1 Tax=Pseudarthrobacter sp. YAF2 TaxID=3233078 RepID=UPI003F97C445
MSGQQSAALSSISAPPYSANSERATKVIINAFTGRTSLTGTLPFDIPSSMEAVENSREDVPFDTKDPLFHAGFGITQEAGAPHVAAHIAPITLLIDRPPGAAKSMPGQKS